MQQLGGNPKKLGTSSVMSEFWESFPGLQVKLTWSLFYQNVMKPILSLKRGKGTVRKLTTKSIRFLALLPSE